MRTRAIYKILALLLKYAGNSEFDTAMISAERMKLSYDEWQYLIVLLAKNGYVDGVVYTQSLTDRWPVLVDAGRIGITLKGIEYVETNSAMKKIGAALKSAGELFI